MRQPNTSAQRAQYAERTDRFTRLPDALISELTPREHQLVHALLSYRWTDDAAIYPSVRTLAAMLRCTDRTIQRTARGLEEKGYLIIQARYRDDQGQTSNLYVPGPLLVALLPPSPDQRVTDSRDDHHPPVTRRAGERDPGNHTHRRDRGTGSKGFDARNYYETREGDLRVRT